MAQHCTTTGKVVVQITKLSLLTIHAIYPFQAHTSDSKLAQTMFLPLAERMTQKYVKDDRIEAEAGM